jgi:hypothetical protein
MNEHRSTQVERRGATSITFSSTHHALEGMVRNACTACTSFTCLAYLKVEVIPKSPVRHQENTGLFLLFICKLALYYCTALRPLPRPCLPVPSVTLSASSLKGLRGPSCCCVSKKLT